MATDVSLAIRRAEAMETILAAAARLRTRLGVQAEVVGPPHKDPDVAWTLQLETFAVFMRAVGEGLEHEGAKGREGAKREGAKGKV